MTSEEGVLQKCKQPECINFIIGILGNIHILIYYFYAKSFFFEVGYAISIVGKTSKKIDNQNCVY